MNSRRAVPFTDKLHVAAKQGWVCQSCKNTLTEFFELDHIKPVALGGTNTTENLQALCSECHRHKSLFDLRRIRKNAQGRWSEQCFYGNNITHLTGITAFKCSRCSLYITTEVEHVCRPVPQSPVREFIAPETAALLTIIDSLRYRERAGARDCPEGGGD